MKIPFYAPYYSGKELAFIKDAMDRGQIGGDGFYTEKVTTFIEEKFNAKKVLMTTSATHAMEMAAMIIDIGPGDEVIMPSFTFPSTANAVILRGAKPVFAEVKEDTLNIDVEDVKRKITSRTKGIMPVHYGGIGCEMDKIMEIAKLKNLYVIEDSAQGVNGKYKEKYLGTCGHIGCYSFHGTKNFMSGEGGALLLNIDDHEMVEHMEIIRQKGTNRNQFIRGEVDKYSWVDMGSSYTPSDILMAFLYAQFQDMDYITSERKRIHDYYTHHLKGFVHEGIVKMSMVPKECDSNYHLFYLLFNNEKERDYVQDQLKNRGIQATIHFVPLHSSPMGQKLGYKREDLPTTERIGKGLLRLPMYTGMDEESLEYVVKNLICTLGEIEGI